MPVPPSTPPGPAPQLHSKRSAAFAMLGGLIAAVVVLVLLSWLAHAMLEGQTLHFDAAVRNAVHGVASVRTTAIMRAASRFGSPPILVPIGVLLAVYFLAIGARRAAVLLPLTMLGVGVLDTVLKESFRRARPTAFFDYPLPTSYSFPSGHAMFAFCFFVELALLLSPHVKQPAMRFAIWTLALLLAFIIGLSRIYLGVHYPSDVVAGWSIGFVWIVVVALGDRIAHRIRHGAA